MARDFFTLDDFDLAGKTVLVRVDINSPVNPVTGEILSDARIARHASTLRDLKRSKVVVIAHQSRPGKDDYISLSAHATQLSRVLKKKVLFVDDLFGSAAKSAVGKLKDGQVLLLENIRFYAEEQVLKNKSPEVQAGCHIVDELAPMADYYVNDAFSAAHRSQPSLVGFCERLTGMAGRVMEKELAVLEKVTKSKEKPRIAVLGGIKVDDSIDVAKNMIEKGTVDRILTTGVVGHIFLWAKGYNLGKVNIEFLENKVDGYKQAMKGADRLLTKWGDSIDIPVDLAVNENGKRRGIHTNKLPTKHLINDIGLDTMVGYRNQILEAKTIMLNGPAGVFEIGEFAVGTIGIFSAVAETKGFTVIGGGETSAVADSFGLADRIDHVSTGGGALISYLAGKEMPAIDALKRSKKLHKKGHYQCK